MIVAHFNPEAGKSSTINTTIIGIIFWAAFAGIWWFVRRSLRAGRQRRYEEYVARQAAAIQAAELAAQEAAAEAQRQQVVAAEQRAAEVQRQKEQMEARRLAEFEPHLQRARQLHAEGVISTPQLEEFEAYPRSGYSSAFMLELNVNNLERTNRAELLRRTTIESKYDADTAQKLLRREIAPGMTREQLIDSLGETSKIERTLTKEGERETLVYGSKTTGSYFHIVGGIITKAVVR